MTEASSVAARPGVRGRGAADDSTIVQVDGFVSDWHLREFAKRCQRARILKDAASHRTFTPRSQARRAKHLRARYRRRRRLMDT